MRGDNGNRRRQTNVLPQEMAPAEGSYSPKADQASQVVHRSLETAAASNTLQQALEILATLAPSSSGGRDIAADAATHRLIGIDARDTLEEMLATQMLALHAASIDCASRAMLPGQDGGIRQQELALATKTCRAFAHLLETLDRRRRGGEQKVRVEHVHVHAGGQAVVGTIERGPRGSPRKLAKQSHA